MSIFTRTRSRRSVAPAPAPAPSPSSPPPVGADAGGEVKPYCVVFFGDKVVRETIYEHEADARALWARMCLAAMPIGGASSLVARGFSAPVRGSVADERPEAVRITPEQMLELTTPAYALTINEKNFELWGLFHSERAAWMCAREITAQIPSITFFGGWEILSSFSDSEIESYHKGDKHVKERLIDVAYHWF